MNGSRNRRRTSVKARRNGSEILRACRRHDEAPVAEAATSRRPRLRRSPSAALRIREKASLDGAGPVAVPFPAWGRTAVLLRGKGPKALAPRITAFRLPSGGTVHPADEAEVLVKGFGKDGTWTATLDGAPGVAGRARLLGRPAWIEGMKTTR